MYIILFLLITWIVAFFIIFSSNRVYCFVFEHEDWKLWNKICKHLQEAKFNDYYEDNEIIIYFKFKLIIDSVNYDIIYWYQDDVVSVHYKSECILSEFDKYHSDKAVEIIKHHLLLI